MVRATARRLAAVVGQLEPGRPASLPGYRVKVFDGNHLAGTEHRIPETRDVEEAVLPGQTLVVYDLDLGLVIDAVPCEDAHAQERTLLDDMLRGLRPRGPLVGDRNFCVAWWFLEVSRPGRLLPGPAARHRGAHRAAGGIRRDRPHGDR